MGGGRGAERGKEWEIVHQSGRARGPNQRDCSSSPHGSDAKSISQGNGEGQFRWMRATGAKHFG